MPGPLMFLVQNTILKSLASKKKELELKVKESIIKVCGMRTLENIRAVDALAPDLMGFIFYRKSPRYVGENFRLEEGISAERVGVFVNEDLTSIQELACNCRLDYLQLHGSETVEYCNELKGQFKLIKAFGIDADFDFSVLNQYEFCDYFVFDTKTKKHGGSGRAYDWNILNAYAGSVPFLLSGGLSLDNLPSAINWSHPQLAGYDLNSGFETSAAIKDESLLRKGFELMRQS